MNTFLIKRLLPAVLFLFFLLALTICGKAQEADPARDSITRTAQVTLLRHRFLIAGELYKIKKYRLPAGEQADPDSLFRKCVSDYQSVFNSIPEQKLPHYFSDTFYETVIPVVQYFRSPAIAGLFFKDQARLHPRAPVPDPKHHEIHNHEDHN